jgi:hypothetical protein
MKSPSGKKVEDAAEPAAEGLGRNEKRSRTGPRPKAKRPNYIPSGRQVQGGSAAFEIFLPAASAD